MQAFRAFSQVLVRNLDSHVNKDLALKVFSAVGEIKSILLEFDPETESNSGFMLLDYGHLETCQKAFEQFNDKKVLGSFVKIEVLREDEERSELKWGKFKARTEYKGKTKPEMFSPII